jgi:hypothetical protein
MRRTSVVSALLAAALLMKGITTGLAAQLNEDEHPPALARFLTTVEQGPASYQAMRRLEVRNRRLSEAAWMHVRTEADADGFRYQIVGEGGSGYVRDRLFVPALETEQKMWGAGDKGALTLDNYTFEDRGAESSGLAWIGVTPRRKDVLLVTGSIFLRPDDGDLVRVEGALSRTPSFWTRNVEIVRTYERIGGVRVPVRLESTASVRIAGTSTFTMTYEYESINGKPVE